MSKKGSLIQLPDPRLRRISAKVGSINNEILELIKLMEKATIDWEKSRKHEVGVALAAVQIGELHRVVIVRKNPDNKEDVSFEVFVNPEITKYEGAIEEDFEGCLSIRDVYGKVPRYSKVRVRAIGLDGKEFRLKAEGFLARVLQHEIDHTNGKVFIDHIRKNPEAFFVINEEGQIEKLDYEKDIKDNKDLWS